ncbi:MAG: 16S rRNA (adenine(1518)-N(6)/adenine(1519)-N(6))-dimethyltransferase RsmA [Puniceicoccales bacterium]|jgi:16S rRNA (adenine1518-N6/adenine1519-N6)-dimethyltransferase|nr:16S rRNA (adenine(1518)-N(6)/adenine(1519)-N(6))-dimethyltransferase RsmA [Puniceicoccales bacterium]
MGQVADLLRSLAVRPSKALGQNFLVDGAVARRSVAAVGPGDRVVEIGPGLGALTERLLETGAEVHAIELDWRLFAFLRAGLAERFPGKLFLIQGDAVKLPRADLSEGDREPYAVVANLPYAITSPWLDALLQQPLPQSMVLLVQLEAADRILAPECSRDRGAIAVRVGSAFQCVELHQIAPSCFYPRPRVRSALLRLCRRPDPVLFSSPARRILRHCFHVRRKQLRTSVAAIGDPALRPLAERWLAELQGAGVDPLARPEDLSVDNWRRLEEINFHLQSPAADAKSARGSPW